MGAKGKNWGNSNSIINKISFKTKKMGKNYALRDTERLGSGADGKFICAAYHLGLLKLSARVGISSQNVLK